MSDKNDMKQLSLGVVKSAIGIIPVAGGLLNELIFEVRGRIKQDRYNHFLAALAGYMISHFHTELTIDQIEEEQIGDFFESVVMKVIRLNGHKRIDALKRLLASKIVDPKEFDYAEVLSELLAGLTDQELLILQEIVEEGGNYADQYSDFAKIQRELEVLKIRERESRGEVYDVNDDTWPYTTADIELQRLIEGHEEKVKQATEELQTMSYAYNPSTYNLEPWQFYFHLNQLVRKGIIQDKSGGLGVSTPTVVTPNQLAFDLMKFLIDEPEPEKN